jgi:osmotically-inducible protein OsmY
MATKSITKKTTSARQGKQLNAVAAKSKSKATGATPDDQALADAVLKALSKIPLFKNMQVFVSAKSGVVTINGTSSRQFKSQATETAGDVQGVSKVNNKLKVPPNSGGCEDGETECFCNGMATCVKGNCPDCIPN